MDQVCRDGLQSNFGASTQQYNGIKTELVCNQFATSLRLKGFKSEITENLLVINS